MIASCLKNVVLFWCKRQVAAVPNKQKLVSSVNIFPPVHYVLMFLCQFKFLSLGQSQCHFLSTWFIIIPPLPEGGRGVYCFTSVHPSVQDIFRRIFLSNCWWQKSDIWSQASYRYTILWLAFLDLSDSYFLFAEERGYHRWALAHSSSCFCKHSCHEYSWNTVDLTWKNPPKNPIIQSNINTDNGEHLSII